jgi:mannose-6-phosphate isomerase-like protein (cupin superfamily)
MTAHPFQFVPLGAGQPLVNGIRCVVSTESTGGAYTVLELILPPNAGAPVHTHHLEDEVFTVVEGVCAVTCDGLTHHAEAGAVVVLPKHHPHAFRNPSPDHPARLLITAVPGGLDHYFAALAQVRADDPDANQHVAEINQRHRIAF